MTKYTASNNQLKYIGRHLELVEDAILPKHILEQHIKSLEYALQYYNLSDKLVNRIITALKYGYAELKQ